MSERDDHAPFRPNPDADAEVPDAVLDELLAAFGAAPDNVVELRPAQSAPTVADAVTQPQPQAPPAGRTAAPGASARPTIVIGGDDELPDAVFLDEAGEERLRAVHGRTDDDSGERSTIVIGDELDASGAFDAVTVAPPSAMDPRVRARRIAVRRAEGRRRLLWMGIVLAVVVLLAGVVSVFASSLFAVRTVDVEGNTYVDEARLQAVVDDLKGTPVLLVDADRLERLLEEDPWVERAHVSTDFPHRAVIDLRERRPLATFQGSDGRYRVVDVDGRVLSVIEGRPIAYMLLTGPAPDADAGSFAGQPYADAAELVAALPAEVRSITTSVGVDAATSNLTLVLERPDGEPVDVHIGTVTQLESKLARVVQSIRQGLDEVVSLEVSTDGISVTTD